MRGSLCRRHRAGTGVGLQAVHRDDLLSLAHLDGEVLCPCRHHLVWAGIWGCQRVLLAANTHIYNTCSLPWPVNPAAVQKMAITSPFGLFESKRMPYGLRNAGASSQRHIRPGNQGL